MLAGVAFDRNGPVGLRWPGTMRTTRRAFVTSSFALLAAPLTAHAQQPGKLVRIGYLSHGTAKVNAGFRKAFTDGLRDQGWIEGRNVAIEYRWQGSGS